MGMQKKIELVAAAASCPPPGAYSGMHLHVMVQQHLQQHLLAAAPAAFAAPLL